MLATALCKAVAPLRAKPRWRPSDMCSAVYDAGWNIVVNCFDPNHNILELIFTLQYFQGCIPSPKSPTCTNDNNMFT